MNMGGAQREQRLIRLTGDGSHTIYVPELDENYHSTFGAVNESLHVFINAGFRKAAAGKGAIRVFEAGFGTGLNALLTLLETARTGIITDYHAIELYPLAEDVWSKLNYAEVVGETPTPGYFASLHKAEWDSEVLITPAFRLKKIQSSLHDCLLPEESYHLVYFDAFGPDKQPDMWTVEIFVKLHRALEPGGVLVTYSTKGQVKRNLKEAGFSIEKLPGPAGKREILRAKKIE